MSLFDDASLVLIPDGAKDSKLYSVKPTDGGGDFTFSRSTTATRVNESGLIESVATNVPRIDYSEGGCPSLLLEPQRTNRSLWSEDFTDASWSKSQASISANATTSPDGTVNADKFVEDGTTNAHKTNGSPISVTSGQQWAVSIFAKAAERDVLQIIPSGTSFGATTYANFDLSNGIVSASANCTASIESLNNGWYKCNLVTIAATISASTGVINLFLQDSPTSARAATYAGDGTSGIYIWGAQTEASSYPTSYIPTNGAAVTRNADSCELTGVSSLIGQTEGTILFKTDFSESTVIHVLGQNLTVTDEQVKIEYSSTQIKFYLNDSLIATKNGTFDFSGTDEIELGNYLGGSQLGGHISNFVTV